MQALGATRRRLRGVLARELLSLGALGVAAGAVLGAFGTRAIIAAFEASNEVDIPASFSRGAVPPIVIGTAVALVLLARHSVRRAGRRPIAVVLRGAA
jgi:putative ABC transport system permease protein